MTIVPSTYGPGYETYKERDPALDDPEYIASLQSCLRWDTQRGEAYLVPPGHAHLRMAPWRPDIEDDMVEHFNEPKVGERQYFLPYPFPRSKAEQMVSLGIQLQDQTGTIALLAARPRRTSSNSDPYIMPPTPGEIDEESTDYLDWPFPCIYDTRSNKYVGKFEVSSQFHAEKTKAATTDVPRKDQSWVLSYNIKPTYRGQGVMSELLGVAIESWVKPFMRIGAIFATTESNNPASQAVMLKNGLKYIDRIQVWDWPIEKGGGTRETATYERKLR